MIDAVNASLRCSVRIFWDVWFHWDMKSDLGFSSPRVTHASGEIFIWPSTIKLNELERIIHISIISLPLHSPLLSDLATCPVFPPHQRFIPVAAAIRTRPTVAHWLRKERIKWDRKQRLDPVRSQQQQQRIRLACSLEEANISVRVTWYLTNLLFFLYLHLKKMNQQPQLLGVLSLSTIINHIVALILRLWELLC